MERGGLLRCSNVRLHQRVRRQGGNLQSTIDVGVDETRAPTVVGVLRRVDVACGGPAAMTRHLAAAVRSTEPCHRDGDGDLSSVAAAFAADVAAFATAPPLPATGQQRTTQMWAVNGAVMGRCRADGDRSRAARLPPPPCALHDVHGVATGRCRADGDPPGPTEMHDGPQSLLCAPWLTSS